MIALAVIPARGGSRGIPRKNLRVVGGKPLVVWSIEAASAARRIGRVIVSTDDDEIADVATAAGAEVMRRPDWAATDDSPIEAALWDVHQRAGAYDYMVTLQPTCPVRADGLIDACIQAAMDLDADSVFTAIRIPKCHLWQQTGGAVEWMDQAVWQRLAAPQQRQRIAPSDCVYQHDGSVCVSTADLIASKRVRQGGRCFPYLVERTVDIDAEADLIVADALLVARSMSPLEGVA